jgi:hypothetical protein
MRTYFIVELISKEDSLSCLVLVEKGKLTDFLTNHDKENYTFQNIYFAGELFTDPSLFLIKDENLETGDKTNAKE